MSTQEVHGLEIGVLLRSHRESDPAKRPQKFGHRSGRKPGEGRDMGARRDEHLLGVVSRQHDDIVTKVRRSRAVEGYLPLMVGCFKRTESASMIARVQTNHDSTRIRSTGRLKRP